METNIKETLINGTHKIGLELDGDILIIDIYEIFTKQNNRLLLKETNELESFIEALSTQCNLLKKRSRNRI